MSRVGLVLTGGGARGAYEAGALSVLLPELERRGERPTLFVGTSVGAINAAYLAGAHHLPASDAAGGLQELWRDVTLQRVVRPLVLNQVPRVALRYVADLLSVPGLRVQSLLDATPLSVSLRRWIDWAALRRNVDDGRVDAVAAVATVVGTGRTVVFCDTRAGLPPHRSHVLDYVNTRLAVEHVSASAAIPVLFAPVRVEQPVGACGWYVDGGVRLNAPIKPALDLGADRLVVIATASIGEPDGEPGRHDSGPPGLWASALNLLHGALVDPLVEDLRALGNINLFFADGDPGAQHYRQARGKRPYRTIPYIFVGPRDPSVMGVVATDTFHRCYGGTRAWRSADFALMQRLLGGKGQAEGELLSLLFFEPEFIERLLELGADDARAWLNASDGNPGEPWRLEPLESLTTPE